MAGEPLKRLFYFVAGGATIASALLGYRTYDNMASENAALKAALTQTGVAAGTTPLPGESQTPDIQTPIIPVTPTGTEISRPDLTWAEWPVNVDQFYQLVKVPDNQISPEYKADPNYRPLNPGMITQEFDKNGNPTGGFQIFFERDAGNNDEFPFVVVQNNSGVMQYGYMHDPNLRDLAGFTGDEVAALGIGDNHIGAGIPVTDGAPVAVEGLTFYPKINTVDGSNNVHFVWTALGPDMQTMSARLARSATSSLITTQSELSLLKPLELMKGNITINVNGSPVNFDGNDDPIYTVNLPHTMGGGLPNRITSFSDLPKSAQAFQRNPFKGIKGA